ncbi:major facilitator superfamily domain-containing protein 4A-like [Ylistrum balloti]|uniref:major facilitator superfamily domain-containing protein 4A-like n=1 Tax=Ylistrum balloti TaxID=509963 RepID=UPI002905EF8C|nr:major facilitator superfamily domain-containing protein 4A-like [Ylistrum balloti]
MSEMEDRADIIQRVSVQDKDKRNGVPPEVPPLWVPEERDKIRFWDLFKENWISVVTDCLVFGSFGMGVAFLGPTLFDLGCQTKSDLKEMNWVFFVQLLMTLVGSISAGCLADRAVPVHVLMLVGMVGLPITMFIIPACSAFAGLLIDLMLMGWCMGCIDCVANLRMIRRFETNVAPFLQAMHFFYGLGAFVSPMIAAPFILNVDCSVYIDGVTLKPPVTGAGENDTMTSVVPPNPPRLSRAINLSNSKTAFLILGSIQLVITVIVVMVVVLEKQRVFGTGAALSQSNSTRSLHSVSSDKDLNDISGEGVIARCFYCGTREMLLVTAITSILLFIFDGLQSSYADYIYSYSEKNVSGIKKGEGAVLNACFWGLFALGRLLSIGIATRFTPAFMLLCNLVGTGIALLLTLICRTDHTVVYVGTCIVGLFISSMSPSCMSMAEQYIKITPSVASCLVVCAALGETLCPVIVGNLFVSFGPPSFLVFCLVIVLIAMLFYWGLYAIGRGTHKYQEHGMDSFLWMPGYKRRKGGENTLIKPAAVKYYSQMTEDGLAEATDKMELDPVTRPSTNYDTKSYLPDTTMNDMHG